MYFFAASIGDVSDCNQFLQECLCSCTCSNTRASTHGTRPHWNFQHTGESITLQRYNRLLLSAWRWTNAQCSNHDNITFVVHL